MESAIVTRHTDRQEKARAETQAVLTKVKAARKAYEKSRNQPVAASKKLDEKALRAEVNALRALEDTPKRRAAFRALATQTAQALSPEASKWVNPEQLNYSAAFIAAELPAPEPIRLQTIHYEHSEFINTKFRQAIEHASGFQGIIRHVIYLEHGSATLPQLYDALRAKGIDDFLTREGKTYRLRRPLIIASGASLTIAGDEVDQLQLSVEGAAFIDTVGTLNISGVRVVGWREKGDKIAWADYKDRYDFRPFINGWSTSEIRLGGNEFTAIGYHNHKSYGISISAGPEKWVEQPMAQPDRPTAIIADNTFVNTYYGFYSYEADDVALIGNEYRDNIIYGIDPHDRSHRLTIAYNTAYGTQKKHGIIVSREVNDSAYIGNLSFANHGSGFMIDRLSTGTFVEANTAFDNGQDGLTLFESSCNLVTHNHFFDNHSMGVRIRNAQDTLLQDNILAGNRAGGIYAYTANLKADPAHARRNFTLDPYSDITAIRVVDNTIRGNGTGLQIDRIMALMMKGNKWIDQSPKLVRGDWFETKPYLLTRLSTEEPLYVEDLCSGREWIPRACRFREAGAMAEDKQADLMSRSQTAQCGEQ